jgi:hypothetical protein
MNSLIAKVSGFFEELKRRKVYRVAVAYVIAAGIFVFLMSKALTRRGAFERRCFSPQHSQQAWWLSAG